MKIARGIKDVTLITNAECNGTDDFLKRLSRFPIFGRLRGDALIVTRALYEPFGKAEDRPENRNFKRPF